MAHIYLSYSRKDSDFVDLIEADLNERGHVIWRDTSNIQNHDNWGEAIEAALQTAYTLVVALSRQALQSDWVKREISFAQEMETPIILALLEPHTIPTHLATAPLIDFSEVRTVSGLEQLRQYRRSISALIDLLDDMYPVRIYLRNLKHADDLIREEAAQKLGDLGDLSAVEALIQSLLDADVDVRYFAAEALGKLRSESALRPLIRLVVNDDDPDVRAAAATALGHIGLSDAITPLIEQLDHLDRFVRAAAATALGQLHAVAAVRPIIHMMRNDPVSDVRRAALLALCQIGGSQATRALNRAGVDCKNL